MPRKLREIWSVTVDYCRHDLIRGDRVKMATTATVIVPPPAPPHSLVRNPYLKGGRLANNTSKWPRSVKNEASDRLNDKPILLKMGENTEYIQSDGEYCAKPKWVLSDNFYLLESPKTCREKGRRVLGNTIVGDIPPVEVIGLADHREVLCKNGKCDDKNSLSNERERHHSSPRLEVTPTMSNVSEISRGSAAGDINLPRSRRHLLDLGRYGGSCAGKKFKVSQLVNGER